MRVLSSLLLAAGLCLSSNAEFVTGFVHGWRISAGGQFNFGANGRLGVDRGAIPGPAGTFRSTRAAAAAANAAACAVDGSGRQTFRDGSFVDPRDAAGVPGETWNWNAPGRTFSYADGFSERSTTYETFGGSDKDGDFAAGASFGLDRAIWKSGAFGVDVGFNFAFFLKDDWFRGEAGGVRKTTVDTEGSYRTDVDLGNADVFDDPWSMNADGTYGNGTFGGPGPVLDLSQMSVASGHSENSRTAVSESPFSIRGDLQMYEFQLTLKPYYELTDWFRVQGTLGAGLDYRNFDVHADGLGDGNSSDWDVYMVCGLGGMFHWNGFCLGCDFLVKVFNDDLDVDNRYVNGYVGTENWALRVLAGYEF